MTVATEACGPTDLAFTGGESIFPAGFSAYDATQVAVIYIPAAGSPVTLTLNTHYSVSIAGAPGAVTVTRLSFPAAPGTVRILRRTAALQGTNFQDLASGFPASTYTRRFDEAAMRDAEIKRDAFPFDGVAYNAGGRRIANLADPVAASDAVTRNWSETSMSSLVAQAATYAAQALSYLNTIIGAYPREKVVADPVFYVRLLGNDANVGTANTDGAAFRHIQHALDHLANDLDLNGKNVTIHVQAGAWSENLVVRKALGGGDVSVLLLGDGATTTALTGVDGSAITVDGGRLWLGGLTLETTGTGGHCITAQAGGTINMYGPAPMRWGNAVGAHMDAGPGGMITDTVGGDVFGTYSSHQHAGAPDGLIVNAGQTYRRVGNQAFTYFVGGNVGTIFGHFEIDDSAVGSITAGDGAVIHNNSTLAMPAKTRAQLETMFGGKIRQDNNGVVVTSDNDKYDRQSQWATHTPTVTPETGGHFGDYTATIDYKIDGRMVDMIFNLKVTTYSPAGGTRIFFDIPTICKARRRFPWIGGTAEAGNNAWGYTEAGSTAGVAFSYNGNIPVFADNHSLVMYARAELAVS